MDEISIRVRKWFFDNNQQFHFVISAHNAETNELMQSVTRNLAELEGFSQYINKNYGGHVIPIL